MIRKQACASRICVAPARERGLKLMEVLFLNEMQIVAPARERGLKFSCPAIFKIKPVVAPARERGLKLRRL